MAMKCVAQMPHPVAAPASPTHVARRYPRVARTRRNRLTATTLARKQTTPASATRRRSCSPPRQDRTRNMLVPVHLRERILTTLMVRENKNRQRYLVKRMRPVALQLNPFLRSRQNPSPPRAYNRLRPPSRKDRGRKRAGSERIFQADFGIWDAIGFDEVADLQKMPKEVVTTLKTYCESGTFAGGIRSNRTRLNSRLFIHQDTMSVPVVNQRQQWQF